MLGISETRKVQGKAQCNAVSVGPVVSAYRREVRDEGAGPSNIGVAIGKPNEWREYYKL